MSRALIFLGLVIASVFSTTVVYAETPAEILATFKTEAAATPGFQGFQATRGENFFKVKHGGEWSCSSCHTDNLMNSGKHAKTEKLIKPLAPIANAERFTDPEKVAKWFKRNCKDVLERECTAQEKGDVMTYILAVGTKPAAPEPVKAVETPKVETSAKPAAVKTEVKPAHNHTATKPSTN